MIDIMESLLRLENRVRQKNVPPEDCFIFFVFGSYRCSHYTIFSFVWNFLICVFHFINMFLYENRLYLLYFDN